MAMSSSVCGHMTSSHRPILTANEPSRQISGHIIINIEQKYQKKLTNNEGFEYIISEYQIGPIIPIELDIPLVKISDLKSYLNNLLSAHTSDAAVRQDLSEKLTSIAITNAVGKSVKRFYFRKNYMIVFAEVVVHEDAETIGNLLDDFDDDSDDFDSDSDDDDDERGCSIAAIEGLKKVKIDDADSSESCAICLNQFMEGMEVICLPCNHMFDRDCVVRWLERKNSCPLCRSSIDEP